MKPQQLVLMPFDSGPRSEERRAERRVAWIKRGKARTKSAVTEVALRDLSQTGCCITVGVPLTIGERVELRFQNLPIVWAEVMWIRAGLYGCKFDVPLPARQVRALTLTTF